MAIGYYQIRSTMPQLSEQEIRSFFDALECASGEQFVKVSLQDYLGADFALLYVASGGSEDGFLEVFEQLRGRSCYLLTSGDSNSLAASMEILSYIRTHGGKGEILHGDLSQVGRRIRAMSEASRTKKALAGRRLGVIGAPSDWLIASGHNEKACLEKTGIETVRISMGELIREIEKKTYTPDPWTEELKTHEFDPVQLEKALEVYGALDRLVKTYNLSALTVRCFDLISRVQATGCLALAILNARGIHAGCEGDVPALISMMILGQIAGKGTFQCNPSRLDTAAGTILLAHCTLPLNMPGSYRLDTHFESKIGVAIDGRIPLEKCTLFKAAGDLSRYYAAEGQLLEAPWSSSLCRTQVTLQLDDLRYFLTDPIGNHHILIPGCYQDTIEAFFRML